MSALLSLNVYLFPGSKIETRHNNLFARFAAGIIN